jgi:23S rRNA (cytosine1962-C5)-methyltransferase
LRITAAAEDQLRHGHPWLFGDSIREANRPGTRGEIAVIYDRRDRFLALGLFDPDSPLRVRLLHKGKPVNLDDAWWRQHLQAALDRRRGLFDSRTTGFRWIHGENDRWPGLVLDRYGDVLVLKLYTAAWFPWLPQVVDWIQAALNPGHLVLRLSRNIQETAQTTHQLQDGQVLLGGTLNQPPVFLESGLRLEADVVRGQKTGFFLDQRENRRQVETLAAHRDVLNAFSFSGGFSLYAARGGARSVTDLDISAHALAAGARNAALNPGLFDPTHSPRRAIQADAFDWLAAQSQPQFDLVILDPPSLARREAERAGALAAYRRLATDGIRCLRPDGILVAASCSAHVSAEEFFAAVREAAARSGRAHVEVTTRTHPPDHPACFPEAHYLKCMYLRLGPAAPPRGSRYKSPSES